MKAKIRIVDYSDYRDYIRDYYALKKQANPNFSYRYLSNKAGINSSSFIKYVIEGKRNLTAKTLLKVSHALTLNDVEAEYFEALVRFNQAGSMKEKNHAFEKLTVLRNHLDYKIVTTDSYDIYSEWYHVIVRELICMGSFRGDYDALARSLTPPITPGKAKKSVELLLELGFVAKNNRGTYYQQDPVIYTGPNIKHHKLIEFQIKMLKMAVKSFETARPGEFLASSTTLGISAHKMEVYKKIIRNCRTQLLELAKAEERPDKVYQVNINMFKMSKQA